MTDGWFRLVFRRFFRVVDDNHVNGIDQPFVGSDPVRICIFSLCVFIATVSDRLLSSALYAPTAIAAMLNRAPLIC